MKTPKWGWRVLVPGVAFLAAWSLTAEAIKRFEAQPGSKLRLEGTSTVHDWKVESPIIGGFMELDDKIKLDHGQPALDGPADGKVNAKVEVTIPVRALKSNNSLMDDVMHKAMKIQQHPQIKYRLQEMQLKGGARAPGTPLIFETKGELTVAGVTRTNQMDVAIDKAANNRLKASGSTSVKMTDFGIQPPAPKIALGAIKTGDDVKISFEWLTAERSTPRKTE